MDLVGTQVAVADVRVVVRPEPLEQLARGDRGCPRRLDHVLEQRDHAVFAVPAHLAPQLVDQVEVVGVGGALGGPLEESVKLVVADLDADESETGGELVDGALARAVGVDDHELALELKEASGHLADSWSLLPTV